VHAVAGFPSITASRRSAADAPSRRLSWYRCACCPPNLSRLLASLHGYLATTDPAGVQLHLYTPASVRADVPGGSVNLRLRTNYPWDGRVEVTVDGGDSAVNQPRTLALRVPTWAADVHASIDGEALETATTDGYLRVHRTWPAGTTLVLELGMPARLLAADPRVDAVRDATRSPASRPQSRGAAEPGSRRAAEPQTSADGQAPVAGYRMRVDIDDRTRCCSNSESVRAPWSPNSARSRYSASVGRPNTK
jgi:hypothetical protein